MRELHLFAGAGGGILGGMLLGHEPVCAVEINPYCQQVLLERQIDGQLPTFPIYGDIRQFDGKSWAGKVDVVCGGFPCQPWSSAGKRLGTQDPRHLWPEMARIISECRPAFVFAENVSLAAFAEPWRDLRRLGYRVPPALCLGAVDVGAPHRRNRWWLLASNTDSNCKYVLPIDAEMACAPNAGDTHVKRLDKRQAQKTVEGRWKKLKATERTDWWAVEPNVGRVAHGVAHRVDRLKALGNGQVPACAAQAFRILMQTHYFGSET